MKRIGNLFDRIADAGNVYAAAHRAASGKREQKSLSLFLENIDVEVAGIVAGLLEDTWAFGKYSEFFVYDPKQRLAGGLVSRHGEYVLSPDDALSCASVEDKTMRKSSRVAEICSGGAKKGAGEVADFGKGGKV